MRARLGTRARCRRPKWPISGVFVGIGLLVLLASAGGYGGLRINWTPSAPLGIWRIVALERPVQRGDRVFVCPPVSSVILEALRRGYLHEGLCPGGMAPLIKTVMAMSGQFVAISRFVYIDGELLPHSMLVAVDSRGRSLPPYRGGLIPPDSVYLHSDFPGSFDSRYFGPLPTTSILGLASEVWTLEP
jgi:conjugative transfer signal peptidase TraF